MVLGLFVCWVVCLCFPSCQIEKAKADLQAVQLRAEFDKELGAERKRLTELGMIDLEVEQRVWHVTEEILTLRCPRCRAAFLDFDGCFSLTCELLRDGGQSFEMQFLVFQVANVQSC